MSEKDLISLWISGLALSVAVYGILERGLANRRAFRLRLTELIDDLVQIDVDEQVYLQDPSKADAMKKALRTSNATRRALLAAQAVDVLAKYRRRVTVPEYIILATALHDTSDTAGERRVLVQAVANLSKETPFQQAVAWRKWAWFNFEHEDFRTARRAVRRSLEAVAPVDDVGRLERFEILLSWFEYEFQSNACGTGSLDSILNQAEEVLNTVNVDEWRVDGSARVREARHRLVAKPTTSAANSGT